MDISSSAYGNTSVGRVISKALEEKAPGPINFWPVELILTIFEHGKKGLPAFASVNRHWKQITETKRFYVRMFSPDFATRAFGKEDLKTCFGMNLGPEDVPCLRLKDYGNVEEELCLLTYFPEEIPVMDEMGLESWVPPRADVIGKLVKKPKIGYHATCFDPNSWDKAINEQREIKGGYWVVTYLKDIGRAKYFETRIDEHGNKIEGQVDDAQKQGEDTDVAEFYATVYAVFMHFVKTGKRCFFRDPANGNYSVIRFKEKTPSGIRGIRVGFGFVPGGLLVSLYGDYAIDNVGVAVSRKSFGICKLGT
jgi:hypothetical protein